MSDDPSSLLALLEEAPAAIAVQRGPELRWELANARYQRLLGGRSVLGHTLAEMLPDWAQLRRILEGVWRDGQRFVAREHRFLVDTLGDGNLREAYFDLICQPLHDGALQSGIITFAIDVTGQVEARQRLEGVATELRRAVEARDEFLSVASHELKTPLTALRLQIQSLQRSTTRAPEAQYSPEQLRAKLDAADRQVHRLVELIETLLDVSRLQGGRFDLTLSQIDLAALAGDVVERFRAAAGAAGSTLTLSAPAPLVGRWDRSRVDQVLTNLLSNAIKYGGREPVTVTVAVERGQGPARAAVRVVDQGIGISPVDQGRLFQRFERAVSRTHYAGLGLGLWISRQIAESLGGSITVESELGVGSCFTLYLPL